MRSKSTGTPHVGEVGAREGEIGEFVNGGYGQGTRRARGARRRDVREGASLPPRDRDDREIELQTDRKRINSTKHLYPRYDSMLPEYAAIGSSIAFLM